MFVKTVRLFLLCSDSDFLDTCCEVSHCCMVVSGGLRGVSTIGIERGLYFAYIGALKV